MTTLTMRLVKGDFIVTGPDIEPVKFRSRPDDWCKTHRAMTELVGVQMSELAGK